MLSIFAITNNWREWRKCSFLWYWLAFNLCYFFNRSIFISKCLHIYNYLHCLLMLFVCYLFSKYPLHYFFIGATSLSDTGRLLQTTTNSLSRFVDIFITQYLSATQSRSNNWILGKKQLNTLLNIIIDNLHYILLFLEEFFTKLIIKSFYIAISLRLTKFED